MCHGLSAWLGIYASHPCIQQLPAAQHQHAHASSDSTFNNSAASVFPLLFPLSLQLYTAAINACMTDEGDNFNAAMQIYNTMQRHGVEPDDLLYGHLIAIAGRCRKLEVGVGCAHVLMDIVA